MFTCFEDRDHFLFLDFPAPVEQLWMLRIQEIISYLVWILIV